MIGVASPESGLVHGTRSDEAVRCVDRFRRALLVCGQDAAIVFDAVRHDPGFAAGHALAAAAHLLVMSPDGVAQAAPHVDQAVAFRAGAPPREQLLVDAVSHWSAGDLRACEARLQALLHHWPQDLVAARLLLVHQLNRGDFRAMRRMTAPLVAANPNVTHARGLHAFALVETGAIAAAERHARAAADAAFDPWAEHALAHVFAARHQPRAALAYLVPRSDRWSACSSFLFTHNWWHVALACLALGEREAALDLFDTRVWGVRKAYCQDQLNAVSLLARVEVAGLDVGDRWAELGDWLAPRTGEHLNGLLDLHYLLGLARAGRDREVSAMRASLADKARTATDRVWREIVPTAAEGVIAYARGQWERAAALLGRALPHLSRLGGSSVQREIFREMRVRAGSSA